MGEGGIGNSWQSQNCPLIPCRHPFLKAKLSYHYFSGAKICQYTLLQGFDLTKNEEEEEKGKNCSRKFCQNN